jgi:2-C-methyl-D-erythritol 4-phosphate cytidylyltransferase
MIFGVILAGGSGERMGDIALPKQFALLCGKPVIVYSVEQFLAADKLDSVIVVTTNEWREYFSEISVKYFSDNQRLHITTGGATRNDSLLNACSYIRENLSDNPDNIVVTHDAARPFVTQQMMEDNLDAIQNCDAVCTAIPVTDTILHATDRAHITNIPNRSEYFQAQTPQTFRLDEFCELYEGLSISVKSALTDACGIFTSAGRNVVLVPGNASNIKITVPQDLVLAEAILTIKKN